jgi:hypothetical protein
VAGIGSAGTVIDSFIGTLPGPNLGPTSEALFDLTLVADSFVYFQTYGFGGGTNGASMVIPSGGFDPFVGIFEGLGPSATFVEGFSDALSTWPTGAGCPLASEITVGSDANECGDVGFGAVLTAGTYTVLLTDALYMPNALFETPPPTPELGDGFTDLSPGFFQTCIDNDNCNTDNGNWALDISLPGNSTVVEESSAPTPEPSTLLLAGIGLTFIGWMSACRRKRLVERPKIQI